MIDVPVRKDDSVHLLQSMTCFCEALGKGLLGRLGSDSGIKEEKSVFFFYDAGVDGTAGLREWDGDWNAEDAQFLKFFFFQDYYPII